MYKQGQGVGVNTKESAALRRTGRAAQGLVHKPEHKPEGHGHICEALMNPKRAALLRRMAMRKHLRL